MLAARHFAQRSTILTRQIRMLWLRVPLTR